MDIGRRMKPNTGAVNGAGKGLASLNPDRPSAAAPVLELHIDELVLHGFAPGDRFRIRDAVERELSRLFLGQLPTLLANPAEIDRKTAPPIKIASSARPEVIGRRVAQSIYQGLS
jgi:hypothetical protein